MNSPHHPLRLLVSSVLCVTGAAALSQDEPNESAAVQRALQIVQEYIAAEQAAASDRVASRGEMLEFKFRTTRENGRYRMLGEQAWREWEMERAEDGDIELLKMIGEPQVESIADDLLRVHCAVQLNGVIDGESWRGVSLRSFDVRLDDDGPRIRHERLLANRQAEGSIRWEAFKKTKNGVRSNLRSSPTSSRNNVIGKVESDEVIEVWNQEKEGWLLARKRDGLVGFIHRSQIDFDAEVEGWSGSSSESESRVDIQKNHPFGVILPGKPGYVLNPYTNSIVDVRGLKAGTLVRDPRDPVKDRAFRVPLTGTPSRAVIVEEE